MTTAKLFDQGINVDFIFSNWEQKPDVGGVFCSLVNQFGTDGRWHSVDINSQSFDLLNFTRLNF